MYGNVWNLEALGRGGEVRCSKNSRYSRTTTHIKTTGGQLHSAVKHGKSAISQRLPIRGELWAPTSTLILCPGRGPQNKCCVNDKLLKICNRFAMDVIHTLTSTSLGSWVLKSWIGFNRSSKISCKRAGLWLKSCKIKSFTESTTWRAPKTSMWKVSIAKVFVCRARVYGVYGILISVFALELRGWIPQFSRFCTKYLFLKPEILDRYFNVKFPGRMLLIGMGNKTMSRTVMRLDH